MIKDNESFRKHITTVHGKRKPYECLLCNNTYKNVHTLSSHISSIHKIEEETMVYGCSSCNAIYSESEPLKVHVKSVHEGMKLFQCQACEMGFTTKRNLIAQGPPFVLECPPIS